MEKHRTHRSAVAEQLRRAIGEDAVSTDVHDLFAASRDLWPRGTIGLRAGRAQNLPDVVVWPSNTEETSAALRVARGQGVPVVAYGGGSGVCGGSVPIRGGMVLDTKRMNRIPEVDRHCLLVRAEAGVIGQDLEDHLHGHGLTSGHFPSSVAIATVGGMIATRSSGQLSAHYGNIEDLVSGLVVALPDGTVWRSHPSPRSSAGPDWKSVFIGSEGTLGVITEATLRVFPIPEARVFRAWHFPAVEPALDAVRRALHAGADPSAVRLYDRLDTRITSLDKHLAPLGLQDGEFDDGAVFESPPGRHARPQTRITPVGAVLAHLSALVPGAREKLSAAGLRGGALIQRLVDLAGGNCLLILSFEGAAALAVEKERLAHSCCLEAGGVDLGPEPARRWWERRHHVSFKMPAVFQRGAFAETLEVAAVWGRVPALYRAVRKAIGKRALVMAHFSHAYADGCSIYFTFASAGANPADARRRYDAIKRDALNAARDHGATFAHHHGVGLAKAPWLDGELGPALAVWRGLKLALDPDDLMNPGKISR